MIPRSRLARVAPILAWAMVLGAAGCIPVRHSVTLAPPIVGQLQRSDGTPVAGVQVAVSTSSRDSTCASAAAITTTDSTGTFELPAITRREYILLIPVDRVFPYALCVGRADSLRIAYRGTGGGYREQPTHVLGCVQAPANGTRVRCSVGLHR